MEVSDFEAPTANIANCDNSYATYILSDNFPNEIHCRDCSSGYVITLDGKCIDYTLNPHCEVATSSTTNFCSKCKSVDDNGDPESYISVAGVC